MLEAINDFLFGTVKKNAERELANYDFEEGTREKSVGDRLGDFFTGRGSAIDEKVKELHKTKLKSKYGEAIELINQNTPHTPDIKIDENTNPDVLNQQIEIGKVKAREYKDAKTFAVTKGIDIPEGMNDPDSIISYVTTKAEEKAEGKIDTKYQRDRAESERIYARDLAETKRQEARQDLQRLENQKMQLKRDADSKDLQIMQMMREDKRSAKERKDRMFMQLMAGLQTLGQGFTI